MKERNDFMLKTLAAQIKQYKKSTILTPIFAALEVVMEVLIPMAMARLVKYGIEGGDTGAIYRYGFLMMAMAMLSLVFGSVCAHTASHASTGFAANLRDGMYRNIQRFSFANIDKYSTAGLVTRMTTDVTNVQNAFQMITRIAVRSPLTLIFSMIVAFVINPELAGVFLIPLVLLGVVLGLIIKRATHLFDQVFKKYDDLNASVQENVSGIRVVKAFVREDFEDKKFGKAATNVYNLFVKAERIIAFNSPVMMLTIYGSVMALSWLGASLVTGGSLDVGDLTAMYDSNALALLPQLDRGTRVLGVINNGGGGIFRALPGADGHSEAMRKLLVQPHAHSFKAIAEQWGMRYLAIRTAEDFDQLDSLEENSQTLVELIPDREQTEQMRLRLANA